MLGYSLNYPRVLLEKQSVVHMDLRKVKIKYHNFFLMNIVLVDKQLTFSFLTLKNLNVAKIQMNSFLCLLLNEQILEKTDHTMISGRP